MGIGLIFGAMGGVGENMQREAEQENRAKLQRDSEVELATIRASLEEQKAKSLAKFSESQVIAAEQRKVAPLKRVGDAAQEIAGSEAHLQAGDIQTLEGGKGNAFDGQPLKTKGMQGNVGIIMKQLESMPEGEDKNNIVKQIKSQQAAEAEGKTRTISNDEAVKIALNKLKVSDPEAYAAYEMTIGKSDREDKRIEVAGKNAELKDARDRAIADQRDATSRYIADLRSADSDKRLDVLIGKLGGGQAGTKEALTFIDGQRKEVAAESSELRQLQKQAIEMGQDPAKVSAEFAPKFSALQRKREQIESDFGSLREQVGLPVSKQTKQSTPSALPQGAKQIGTSGGRPVYQLPDGTRIVEQ